ncbi:MAG: hypothetical protein JXR96_18805 [Deltaproteobacteria bacterium]|nr:hypothetical protein [Deltaproteobacteria bacterium]
MTLIAQGTEPALGSDSQGNPHVVYQDRGIWYTFRNASGEWLASPVKLSGFGMDARLFLDEDDDVHVVWSAGGGSGNEGWYTNNVGEGWKEPVMVCDVDQSGGDRVMLGRVVKIVDEDLVVAVWNVGGDEEVFVAIRNLSSTRPTVLRRANHSNIWPPGLILDENGSGFKTIARNFRGHNMVVSEFGSDLALQGSAMATSGGMIEGECASGFRTPDGIGHYTGSPLGEDLTKPAVDHLWYNNDERIGSGQPAIVGEAITDGDNSNWSEICVDATGRAYLVHNSGLEPGLFFTYREADQLLTFTLDVNYTVPPGIGLRYGPMCSSTSSSGVHVVYQLGNDIYHRTIGVLTQ